MESLLGGGPTLGVLSPSIKKSKVGRRPERALEFSAR